MEQCLLKVDIAYEMQMICYMKMVNVLGFVVTELDNPNNHGTGCTLSSAIACNLAEGIQY